MSENEDALARLAQKQTAEIRLLRDQLADLEASYKRLAAEYEKLKGERERIWVNAGHLRESLNRSQRSDAEHTGTHMKIVMWLRANEPDVYRKMQSELIFGE